MYGMSPCEQFLASFLGAILQDMNFNPLINERSMLYERIAIKTRSDDIARRIDMFLAIILCFSHDTCSSTGRQNVVQKVAAGVARCPRLCFADQLALDMSHFVSFIKTTQASCMGMDPAC